MRFDPIQVVGSVVVQRSRAVLDGKKSVLPPCLMINLFPAT